ncbi:hypothetical protein VTJ83DRAFT_231 [Remersonia thermophila]|uniref:Endosomal/vacuolar adapter protein YPT35 n=1 Tax=Remersonia thermophila TaxID=72144 RepID=A0ABR4DKF5_9PEZI
MSSAQPDQPLDIARDGDRSASSAAPPPVADGAAGHAAAENGHGNCTSPAPNPQAQGSQARRPLFSDDEDEDDDDNDDNDNDNASEASIPSDQVSSPNVSIPPYWSHPAAAESPEHRQQPHDQRRRQAEAGLRNGHAGAGARARARPLSTASSESVLPPGAITLRDNERDESDDDDDDDVPGRRSSSSELYGRDRNRACWARSVQVKDYVMVNGSTTNIGAFVVWNIRVETLSGSRINICKRYSEFDDLRRKLVQTFPNFEAAVPALPPKSVLKRFQPRFLEKRRAGLQYFLNCILLNPEFSGSPVLKEFLFS